MKKRLSLKKPHNFADLASNMSSDKYTLPGNTITVGQLRKIIEKNFRNEFKRRLKDFKQPECLVIKVNPDKLINEKIFALTNIMVFCFSMKKPSGLCAVTENKNGKNDNFYEQLDKIHKTLVDLEKLAPKEVSFFYPKFSQQYTLILNSLIRVTTNLNTVGSYNNRLAESVLEAIHLLKMNPYGLNKDEIHELIKKSIEAVKKNFPDLKQYQSKAALQQYFSQELNYIVTHHNEAGPRRLSTADKSKVDRRKAEENEFKKKGF